jgi:hypothetical protein
MWLSTDSTTVVDVSSLTRKLDVDFNGLTGVVDVSLLTRMLDVDLKGLTGVVYVSLLTRTLDMDFNGLTGVVEVSLLTRKFDVDFDSVNYLGGRLFIDSCLSPYFPASTSALLRGGVSGRGY